jgi:hypothetical protein
MQRESSSEFKAAANSVMLDERHCSSPQIKQKGRTAGMVPSAARPSYGKTRRFPPPSHEGFGFSGSIVFLVIFLSPGE